jgi:hypothetical protein
VHLFSKVTFCCKNQLLYGQNIFAQKSPKATQKLVVSAAETAISIIFQLSGQNLNFQLHHFVNYAHLGTRMYLPAFNKRTLTIIGCSASVFYLLRFKNVFSSNTQSRNSY